MKAGAIVGVGPLHGKLEYSAKLNLDGTFTVDAKVTAGGTVVEASAKITREGDLNDILNEIRAVLEDQITGKEEIDAEIITRESEDIIRSITEIDRGKKSYEIAESLNGKYLSDINGL